MSTRSIVAVKEKNSEKIKAAYVHHDGYLSGVGMTLLNTYNSVKSARKIVKKGHYSSLGDNFEESLNKSNHKEKPSVYKNMVEFQYDIVCSDWEYAYLFDVDKDEWMYAKRICWERGEGRSFDHNWSNFKVMLDDVLKDVLATAHRLEDSKFNGDYDDYVVELRDWAADNIVNQSV
jgi:phage/plasmid-associated DNA primase